MDHAAYTVAARQAAERYAITLAALRSLLPAYIAKPFSVAATNDLRAEANDIRDAFLRNESASIQDAIRNTAQNAQRRALSDLDDLGAVTAPDDRWKAFLEHSSAHLESEVSLQLSRDVETLVGSYREFALQARLKSFANPFGSRDADRIAFIYRDRAGRRSQSDRFIQLVWRHSLVSLGAEIYLLTAAHAGASICEVQHDDPSHRHFGRRIAVTSDQPGEAFSEVRDEIFHPMTNATLKARH